MHISINTSKWYDRIWASFIFFTRLPFWRLHQPPRQSFETVVEHWPLTGWMTGCAMASVLWFGSMIMPWAVAVLLAIVLRLLLTGALHEDGLADFFDGFGGGGSNRELILDIMKDSRTGTYGVLGLIIYELLLFFCLFKLRPEMAALAVIAADPYSKMITAQLTQMMPYARTEASSKAHVVYRKFTVAADISLFLQGIIPLLVFLFTTGKRWDLLVFVPCLVMYFLYLFIWRRLRGYTGDCCGAVCLLTELSFYLTLVTIK